MFYILAIASVAVFSTPLEATVCTTDSDCAAGQCCYIKPQFMVVSKRQSILPLQPTLHDTGVCENYRVEHEHCGPLEVANGHCGCGTGMSCQFVPAQTIAPDTVDPATATIIRRRLAGTHRRSNRRSIYMPGPGTFQCEMI